MSRIIEQDCQEVKDSELFDLAEREQLDRGKITLTKDILEFMFRNGRSERGGWNKAQMKAIGFRTYNPKTGWKERMIGTDITLEEIEEFIRLKGCIKTWKGKKRRRR